MQFSKIMVLVAITVASAFAAPAPNGGGGSSSSLSSCGSHQTQLCCDQTALIGLACVLSSVLGNTCTDQTICCVNNGGKQTCTDTSGTTITVPINIGINL